MRETRTERARAHRGGLARLIALFAVLSFVPLALLTHSGLQLASNAVRREVESRLTSNAALSAAAVREEMRGLSDLVESYAKRPYLVDLLAKPGRLDRGGMDAQLSELLGARTGIATAFVAAPDGTLLSIVPATPSILGRDFGYRDWYRGVTSTDQTYVSEAYQSLAAGHPLVVAAATPIRAPDTVGGRGRDVGILVAAYDLGTIQRFVSRFSASQDVALTITDQGGILLAAPGSPETDLVSRRSDPLVAAALRGEAAVTTRAGQRGDELVAYQQMPGIGWTVVASVPKEVALARIYGIRDTVVAVATVLGLAMLAGMLVLARTLNARRRAEREAREANAFLDSVVENIPHMLFVKDAQDLRFVRFNRAGEELLGLPREELIGRNDHDLFPKEQADEFTTKDHEVLGQGTVLDIPEEPIATPSGPRLLHTKKIPILDAHGAPRYLLGISEDITERNRVETERNRFFTMSLDMLCVADFNGYFTQLNPVWQKTLGWTVEELQACPFIEFVHPDDRDATTAEAAKLATGDDTIRFENRYRCKDGSYRWMSWSATATIEHGLIYAVARDVTNLKEDEEALRQAKEDADQSREEAEQANHAKSEFLSRMSHELRTPLNAILGFGQLLEMDHLDGEQEESVRQILKGGRHLLGLINEVLDISRIESGRIALSLEPVSVEEAAIEALDLIRPLAVEREVGMRTDVPSVGYVLADRQRLKQVLLNLLSNGVKYGRPNGTVTLRCRAVPGEGVSIEVGDDGPGIAPEDLARLFVPFERLSADRTGVEGTGLGLALSKRLVDAMGGTLQAESTPGRGSVFRVRLPAAENPDGLLKDGQAFEDEEPERDSGPRTLLYIEDNAPNLRLIERVVGARPGHRLLAAMQGSLGLDLARQHHPDLILLDVNLPDISGAEVLRRLRDDPRTVDIPVVVVSADATEDRIRALMALGANAYLTKPIDVRRLTDVIDEALEERRLDHAG